jgi:hypothetical protein
MSTAENQYVGKRAKLLANLILTRRQDVRVFPLQDDSDTGLNLLVQVSSTELGDRIVPSFDVQVKGTVQPLEDEASANKYGNRLAKQWKGEGWVMMPTLVFLFSVENDRGYYSWIFEPSVDTDGFPRLTRVSPLEFKKVGKDSVDGIIEQVQEWSQAMAHLVLRPAPAR